MIFYFRRIFAARNTFDNVQPLTQTMSSQTPHPLNFHMSLTTAYTYTVRRTEKMFEQAKSTIGSPSNSWAACLHCHKTGTLAKVHTTRPNHEANNTD